MASLQVNVYYSPVPTSYLGLAVLLMRATVLLVVKWNCICMQEKEEMQLQVGEELKLYL